MAELYKELDKKTLKKLHQVELEILDAIVKVCDDNDLTYFLAGGTLLGAVRHKGFIPWDDDIDIAMPREDYEKFLEIAQYQIGKEFYVQSSKSEDNYWLPFAKVRKNGTTFANSWHLKSDAHSGIFVDIFPLDYTNNPNSKLLNLNITLAKNFVETLILKRGYHEKLSDCRHPVLSSLVLPYKMSTIQQMIDKLIMMKQNKKERKYVASFAGVFHYKKDMYPYDEVFPYSIVEFEGKKYKTFNNTDFYLRRLYGDYMKLPPKNKRTNHAPEIIDFENGPWRVEK